MIEGKRAAAAVREALEALLLKERHMQSETVSQLLANRHDLASVAQSVELDLHELSRWTSPEGAEILRELQASFSQVRALLARPPVPVLWMATSRTREAAIAALAVARIQYPDVHVTTDAWDDLHVYVCGGEPALRRMLLRVVENACEGSGKRRAETVRITAERHPSGILTLIHVLDDGPGLPPAMLTGRAPFETTKPKGSGLGLVTVEALMAASAGRVRYANRTEGGAQVTLELLIAGRAKV